MAEITYCGRREARYMQGPWDAIVSINDPDEPTPPLPATARLLRLEFYDLDRPFENYTEPQPEHVQQLLELARTHLDANSRVLVHCHAGISRSAAAALILAIALGQEPYVAIDQVVNGPGKGLPNKLLLALAEAPLGLPGLAEQAWAAVPSLKE